MLLDISSRKTLHPVGHIEMDDQSGVCRFVDGPDELRSHVERAMSQGIHVQSNLVRPSETSRFPTAFDHVLSMGGFCLTETADWIRSQT